MVFYLECLPRVEETYWPVDVEKEERDYQPKAALRGLLYYLS